MSTMIGCGVLKTQKIALLTLYYTGTSSLFETVCDLSICRSSQVEHMLMRQLWVKIIVKWNDTAKSSVSAVQCIKVWSIQSQPGRKLGKVGLRHSMGSKNTFLTQSSRKSSGDIIIISKYSNCQVLSPKKCKPNVPFPNGSADVQCLSSLLRSKVPLSRTGSRPGVTIIRNCPQPTGPKR